ncbi:uncharacterized protein LOC143223096 isoform X2 [Tachypleus tridentatus]|uniref:uncharacterized protein LOC143223096 isoform X2 n=1 Tax=Tachypleus tridentatus TaxID=6853 RepID=UPI003FD5E1B7
MYSKMKGGTSSYQSANKHTRIEKRKMNLKINNPYKENKDIIVSATNIDEQLSTEDGPESSNTVTESSDSSQLRSVSTQTEIGINAFTSIQALTRPFKVVSNQESFQRDKKLEALTDSYLTDFSRDSALQKVTVGRITGSRKGLTKPSVMCSPSFHHQHSEVKQHLANPSCNASTSAFVNHHKSLYHQVPGVHRSSIHYTGYLKADKSSAKSNLYKSTSDHFAEYDNFTQSSASPAFNQPRSTTIVDHHEVQHSPARSDFNKPSSGHYFHHLNVCQKSSKSGMNDPVSASYTDSHGNSQLQVNPGVVGMSYGSNKKDQSFESDTSSSLSSPSHTSEEGREAQYFRFSLARPCSETGRSPPARPLPRTTNQYSRGLQTNEVSASTDNKSMLKKKRLTPFDVSRSPATKQTKHLTDVEKILPEVLNKSDQFYSELRAFRESNFSECTRSEVVSDDFTPITEDLENHQCIHEYKTNERLFHVPLHCNNEGQSMCSICNLTKAEVSKKTPHQIKITLPRKRIFLHKYPQLNKRKSNLNPNSLALIRNIQKTDKSRKVPCLLFH